MLMSLMEGLDPRTLMERQYMELWADASWKLRRLSRWEAQLWEADTPDEDALLAKLERLSRRQTTLRRQLDKAVRMLGGVDVPTLYAQRARRAVFADKGWTEVECRTDRRMARDVEAHVLADLQWGDRLHGLDQSLLDSAAEAAETQNCQNELTADTDDEGCPRAQRFRTPPDAALPRRDRNLSYSRWTSNNPSHRGDNLPRRPHALKM